MMMMMMMVMMISNILASWNKFKTKSNKKIRKESYGKSV